MNSVNIWVIFILVLLDPDLSIFENTADLDQLASDEAIWLGSTVFDSENTVKPV